MAVSRRIEKIVEMIRYPLLGDIGTDHGYIPITACLKNIVSRASACDIHPLPLERAKQNIAAAGLESRIETRLGYGLSPIKNDECGTITICGMGGLLMGEILLRGRETARASKQVILQPQRDVPSLRKIVRQAGCEITGEYILKESGQYYFFLDCRAGRDGEYTEREYLLGRFLPYGDDPVYLLYIEEQIIKYENILSNLSQSGRKRGLPGPEDKRRELIRTLGFFKEAYKRLHPN